MMKILITGGAGFIGSATGKSLLSLGHEVYVLDNLQPPVHPKSWDERGAEGAIFIPGDVRDDDVMSRALAQVDAVLHLAAYQDFRTDWSTFFETNAAGTARIYEIIVRDRLPVQRVVLASTQSLLGEGAYDCISCGDHFFGTHRDPAFMARGDFEMYCPRCHGVALPAWTTEEEVSPAIPYGISKHAAEQISTHLGQQYGIPTVNLRYSIVQGATQSPRNAYSGVLRAVALQILGGSREIMVFEDGQQLRDFIAIEDVVSANVGAIHGVLKDGAYNVGGGRALSVEDLAEKMIKIAGVDAKVVKPGMYRVGDIKNTLSSTYKIECYGWEVDARIEDCWARYWDWVQTVITPKEAKETVERAYASMLENGGARKAVVST